MRIFLLTLLTVCSISFNTVSAQRGNPAQASDSTSLQEQFELMLKVSYRYKQSKTVNEGFLNAFMANVGDSINIYTKEIGSLNSTITSQSDKIDQLTEEVKVRDGNILGLTHEKDNISLLGIPLSKATYATIMWSAIFGLLALLIFALLRMRLAISGSNEARDTSVQLSEDLDKAKKRRLEIEQNLRRELRDERNKRKG